MITFESLKDLEILDNTPLGEGAFSFVYKVKHRRDEKTYAMKKIDILQLSKADCENLKLEIKLHQSLIHQNIIRFHGCIQRKNLVYMLLEHASNGSLFFYIDIQEGLPEILALRFFYETAIGIRYLHQQNIVHRDIKPENILLDKDFQIKVCDFGWSCNIEGDDVRYSTYNYI